MNNSEIAQIAEELQAVLAGQKFGRIFPLSRLSMAVDLRGGAYLFVSVEPANPRVYLIKRRLKDLERASVNPTPFILFLKKHLSNAELAGVRKLEGERVLVFDLAAENETGGSRALSLVAQLTGKSANLFVVEGGVIIERLRDTTGEGQEMATHYRPPQRAGSGTPEEIPDESRAPGLSLSEILDEENLSREAENASRSKAEAARKKLRGEIGRRRKLAERLQGDLKEHGDAEKWKRYGDLLLANAANARREGDKIFVVDYFDENTPEISIEGDENLELTAIAEKYFRRYTKARNAAGEIERRMHEIESELAKLESENERLEEAIAERDESFFAVEEKPKRHAEKKKDKHEFNGARVFTSSDGYEILVGKKAKDNDFLTFRLARSLDTWLHAADYPGSHVVIRNPNRKEIPQKTLIEAAELAAFYSDAREKPKAAVNYTQKKFVNKPRGAAPGLVRLASFKTVMVVPRVPF